MMSFWFGQWTACSQSVATVPEDGCVVIIGSGWVGNFNMKRICIDVSLRVWTNCWLWMFFWMPLGSKSSSVVLPWSVTCLSSGCLLAIFVLVFSDGTKYEVTDAALSLRKHTVKKVELCGVHPRDPARAMSHILKFCNLHHIWNQGSVRSVSCLCKCYLLACCWTV